MKKIEVRNFVIYMPLNLKRESSLPTAFLSSSFFIFWCVGSKAYSIQGIFLRKLLAVATNWTLSSSLFNLLCKKYLSFKVGPGSQSLPRVASSVRYAPATFFSALQFFFAPLFSAVTNPVSIKCYMKKSMQARAITFQINSQGFCRNRRHFVCFSLYGDIFFWGGGQRVELRRAVPTCNDISHAHAHEFQIRKQTYLSGSRWTWIGCTQKLPGFHDEEGGTYCLHVIDMTDQASTQRFSRGSGLTA